MVEPIWYPGLDDDEEPNTSHGDIRYFGLTHAQAASYHARLSGMWAASSRRFADLAVKHANAAVRWSRVGLWLAALGFALAIISHLAGA